MEMPLDPVEIARAAALLRAGELVAFPTETVYGLGADAENPLAVRRIFAAKGRPAGHPLIVHLSVDDDPRAWAELDERALSAAAAFWPGPLTLILPRRARVPDEVTGGLETVGLRVPDHPVAQALLASFGGGIAAPSANRFGRVSPTTAAHVRVELGPELAVLDGGACPVGVESTILDLSRETPALLRPGAVTLEALEARVGPVALGGATAAPGTLPAHYAPHTALVVTEDAARASSELRRQGLEVAVLYASDAQDYARRLYAELRRLDDLGVDVLVAERVPDAGLGRAINDRLQRAARGSGEAGGRT